MVLLDVVMPYMDGFALCREIRRVSNVPIIMITARGEDFERVMGLDIGADDYIVKPFSGEEVMARIRAILRRMERVSGHGALDAPLVFDNLSIHNNAALSIFPSFGYNPINLVACFIVSISPTAFSSPLKHKS
jgi:DNA-binding response OmpR family regulator